MKIIFKFVLNIFHGNSFLRIEYGDLGARRAREGDGVVDAERGRLRRGEDRPVQVDTGPHGMKF